MSVNVVLVREEAPPEGEEPIEWVLVTTLPIGDVEAVRTVIAYYTIRWMIELLFRTLKSGCRVEERRFEHIDRLIPCVAVYLIIAWRTLTVCRMSRSCPDIGCEAIFEPDEWRSVYVVTRRRTAAAKASWAGRDGSPGGAVGRNTSTDQGGKINPEFKPYGLACNGCVTWPGVVRVRPRTAAKFV